MRRILVVVATTALALIGLNAPVAWATGGSYPSQAPTLASGQTVSGGEVTTDGYEWPQAAGHAGVQYYRVALNFGDTLVVDLATVAGAGTGVCVMDPAVTDYTVDDAECATDAETGETKRAQLRYTAPASGTYLLPVYVRDCCGAWAYQMAVTVAPRIAPALKLKGPKVARLHQTILLKGTISPALHKRVTLKSKSPAHGWIVAGKAKPVNGRFSFRYYLGHRGRHQFQVFFTGGGSHDAAASKVLTLNVH